MGIDFVDTKSEYNENSKIIQEINGFSERFNPLEKEQINILQDKMTKAIFWECHIRAEKLTQLGTIDAPLDPDLQPEYRANRDLTEDNVAFTQMKQDAKDHRVFSNIVAEYNITFDKEHPLKIIGGQHRFIAISEAFAENINELHGVKVYFDLDTEQRLDVQLISNTNIAVSFDLLDRMFETVKGPELRDWCQKVRLLDEHCDFADKKQRGSKITVRGARTFIMNYYLGQKVNADNFDKERTMPVIAKTGGLETEWEELKQSKPEMWVDKELAEAGEEFAKLIESQNAYFVSEGKKTNREYADKALNHAILAAWAYISGVLSKNRVRLDRHYSLALTTNRKDPLNAPRLAKARHKTDPANYRGLGSRTDAKERGRLSELFFLQAEKGQGISMPVVDLAIMKYHAKQATLDVIEAEKRI